MTNPFPCFECDKGKYKPVVKLYEIVSPNGEKFFIDDVPSYECGNCGDEIIGDEGLKYIERNIPKEFKRRLRKPLST